MTEICVCCGEIIPEGRQVYPNCENKRIPRKGTGRQTMCEKCDHKTVCSIYRATGGVNKCEHHKEERRGTNISPKNPVDEFICSECGVMLDDFRRIVLDDDDERFFCEVVFSFCPLCGADVREAPVRPMLTEA